MQSWIHFHPKVIRFRATQRCEWIGMSIHRRASSIVPKNDLLRGFVIFGWKYGFGGSPKHMSLHYVVAFHNPPPPFWISRFPETAKRDIPRLRNYSFFVSEDFHNPVNELRSLSLLWGFAISRISDLSLLCHWHMFRIAQIRSTFFSNPEMYFFQNFF